MNIDTLTRALQWAAETKGEEAGYRILDRREQATWHPFARVADNAARIASGLRQRGVKPGDAVAIVLPTGTDFIDVFFACNHLGAIPVPLYPPVRLGRLDEYYERTAGMLKVAQVAMVLTDARVGKLLGRVLNHVTPPLGMCRVSEFMNADPIDAHPSKADDIAMVQFSSGTTGIPKPVVLSHQHVISNSNAIIGKLREKGHPDPSGVSWLPLYHDMGLIGCVFPAVLLPGTLTLIPPELFLARPSIWLRALSKYGATISPAPNFAYALCVDRIRDEQMEGCDLSKWLYALNGAEPISPSTMRAFYNRFQQWGLRAEAMTPVYGLSEAALAVTMSAWNDKHRTIQLDRDALIEGTAKPCSDGIELTSVGRPLPEFDIDIRAEDGTTLADGTIGRLWARGPSIMERYLDNTPPPRDGEWLDTGDLGFVHDGELYITGRAKDVIVIRGKNHPPQSLEAAVDTVPGVRTGCAAAVGDISSDGERVILFVEKRDADRESFAEECRQAVLSATGIDPDLVIPLEAGTLPRTSSGKIRRSEALKRWSQGVLIAPETVNTVRVAGAIARSLWTEWQHRVKPND